MGSCQLWRRGFPVSIFPFQKENISVGIWSRLYWPCAACGRWSIKACSAFTISLHPFCTSPVCPDS